MCIHFLALLFTLPSTAFLWLPPGVLGDSVGLTGGARGEGQYRCCSSHSSHECWPAKERSPRVSYQRCREYDGLHDQLPLRNRNHTKPKSKILGGAMQSCAGKARNGFVQPILKLANLRETF